MAIREKKVSYDILERRSLSVNLIAIHLTSDLTDRKSE